MSSPNLEVRVGLFVLAAAAALVAFVLLLSDFSLSRNLEVVVDFGYVGGLAQGAPVKVSGVRVGNVDAIDLILPGSAPEAAAPIDELGRRQRAVVRATLALEDTTAALLTEGVRFAIGTQGVIGESYVEVRPGALGAPQVNLEVPQRGTDAPALHEMALRAAALLDVFSGLSESDGKLGPALARLIDTANSVLTERRGELSQAVLDLSLSAADVRILFAELRDALGDGKLTALVQAAGGTAQTLDRELPALLARAQTSVRAIDQITNRLAGSLDPETLVGIIGDTKAAAQNLAAMTHEGRALVASVQRGEGTVGGLVTDPQMYDDLKELLRDLKRHPWKVFWRD